MENDNIKLLRECDAGVEMGMSSIDDVLPLTGHVGSNPTISAKQKGSPFGEPFLFYGFI